MTAPPPVFYTCSYVPPEAILAAGCSPVRLLADGPAPGECDAYLPRDFCPYVRATFWNLRLNADRGPAALVLTTCCDPMRRLADAVAHHLPRLPVLLLDLPRDRGPHGVDRFARELEGLHTALASLPGAVPLGGGLAAATDLFARLRQALGRARRVMTGAEFHRLVRRALSTDPREALAWLQAPDSPGDGPGRADSPAVTSGGPGVVVITSHPVDPEVLEGMERAGARVVGEDSCLGDRALDIPPGGAGWRDLARAYLGRPPCPRMEEPHERVAYLEDLARRRGACGFIFLALKFCDNLGYDFPWILGRTPFPVLFLEADYHASSWGQFLTRVQAFLETLPGAPDGGS